MLTVNSARWLRMQMEHGFRPGCIMAAGYYQAIGRWRLGHLVGFMANFGGEPSMGSQTYAGTDPIIEINRTGARRTVLHRNAVSQQTVMMGHLRRIDDVRDVSAVQPIFPYLAHGGSTLRIAVAIALARGWSNALKRVERCVGQGRFGSCNSAKLYQAFFIGDRRHRIN